jgi:uncharacterized membrane protein YccC
MTVAWFLYVLGIGTAVGPSIIDRLLGYRWGLTPDERGFLFLIGISVFFMGVRLARDEAPRGSSLAVVGYILLTLVFWQLRWFYPAAVAMLLLAGIFWWLERRSKATESLEQRR